MSALINRITRADGTACYCLINHSFKIFVEQNKEDRKWVTELYPISSTYLPMAVSLKRSIGTFDSLDDALSCALSQQ